MRITFGKYLTKLATKNKKIVLLTGDLGHGVFEELAKTVGERYINAGVAEHNMSTVAAGMAYTGMMSWIYSAAPFVTIKVLEEVRNDITYHNANVKIVGLGGGFDYGMLGPSHHVLQDISMLMSLPNIKIYAPAVAEDMIPIMDRMVKHSGPDYLRLTKAENIPINFPAFKAVRNLAKGNKITVIVLGSIIKDVVAGILPVLKLNKIDLWVVCEMPFKIEQKLIESINRTKNLCVIEEHVKTGGLGEFISHSVVSSRLSIKRFTHLFATGYKTHHYGYRDFYLKENGLDQDSIKKTVTKLI
ncbi:hypothetical protein A2954_01285 [Candidatus Roizmanbacteria bacterium RIFCSPLOWO2_01_FULL_37_12]|uniref:Transketolase-like pyrimidine-binding domain-containing protein n=1 Tax=Candidatus Roizmanbacteria bacterium RIFCSPLOWO2_01_FULL_37_12 TaxID=1802056 RepID=A0A1F7IGH5_9BACT|nr:MAG: hypothetical protein A2954_01285 [Candidatus Roizmanbacteria bacterium RIFCSPLOWO2_01_FULL_37_12]